MFRIYEDDYAQTSIPRWDSDGAVELYWDHPDFPKQWSGRHCEEFPYDNWGAIVPLSSTHGLFGAWSLDNIILGRFGLYRRGVKIPFHELLTMAPELLTELQENPEASQLYRDAEVDESCRVLIPDFSEINHELVDYFSRNPEQLHRLDWQEFEDLLAAIFKNQGFETTPGPRTGDGGVDLRLIRNDSIGPVLTLVQAKQRDPKYPVKLEPVAALYGVVTAENASRGVIATTSRFLPSAQRFAAARSHKLVLAGPDDIARWCRDIVK